MSGCCLRNNQCRAFLRMHLKPSFLAILITLVRYVDRMHTAKKLNKPFTVIYMNVQIFGIIFISCPLCHLTKVLGHFFRKCRPLLMFFQPSRHSLFGLLTFFLYGHSTNES